MDRKNRSIGLFLLAILMFGYSFFANKSKNEKLAELKAAEEQQKLEDEANGITNENAVSITEKDNFSSNDAIKVNDSTPQVEAQLATLENDKLKLILSSNGGRIIEAILKEHESYETHFSDSSEKKPVSLYNEENSEFSWDVNGKRTGNMSFELTEGADFVEFRNGEIVQRYELNKENPYLIDYSTKLGNANDAELTWITNFTLQEKDMRSDREFTFFAYKGEKGKLKKFKKPKENVSKNLEEPVKYIVQRQRFFNQTIIDDEPSFENVKLNASFKNGDEVNIKKLEAETEVDLKNGVADFQILISPNNRKILKSVESSLANIQPKGILGLTKALSWLFDFFRPYFNSYGLLILFMTLLIKLILTPLTYRSYLSQAKMSVLKPEIAELNEKYKNDAAKKQSEQMKLYNKAGVSPMGGCIPSLLQIPIFFSLYYFFRSSIFFRQKEFLWAKDLSTYDEIIKLPFDVPLLGDHISIFAVMYGIALFFSMKMTSKLGGGMGASPMGGGSSSGGGDMQNMMQTQMKFMQYAMPVFLPIIFNSFPVALTFYYFCYNIINGLQTLIIKKFIIDEDKIHAQIQENKKKPAKKKNKFSQRFEDMMKQQAELKKQQETKKK